VIACDINYQCSVKPISPGFLRRRSMQQHIAVTDCGRRKLLSDKHPAIQPLTAGPVEGSDLAATLLRVAWLSVVLGLTIEVLLIILQASSGTLQDGRPLIPDFVNQVSWAVFVCVGLAVGTAAAKMRAPAMGLAGLFAAPLAFAIARFLQRVAGQALGVTVVASAEPSLYLVALLKAVEYASLGTIIGWVGRQPWGGVSAHVVAGLVIAALLAQGVNEILFPVGCALVLFTAQALGKRAAR
jgi:hypothetical protein